MHNLCSIYVKCMMTSVLFYESKFLFNYIYIYWYFWLYLCTYFIMSTGPIRMDSYLKYTNYYYYYNYGSTFSSTNKSYINAIQSHQKCSQYIRFKLQTIATHIRCNWQAISTNTSHHTRQKHQTRDRNANLASTTTSLKSYNAQRAG